MRLKMFARLSAWVVLCVLFSSAAVAQKPLSGNSAVEHLKQTGGYDSLMDAVKAAQNSQNIDAPEAIGQSVKLSPTTETPTAFGSSVAISGTTAVVGAPAENNGRGAIYIYVRTGGGTGWAFQQRLVASDTTFPVYYGTSVAISGDTIVVGARNALGSPGIAPGAAYVYVRSGGVWAQQQKLTVAADTQDRTDFGYAVAIDTNTIVIGAPYKTIDPAITNQGAAYVFTRSGMLWSLEQRLSAADGAVFDDFGVTVSISGDTIVAGANGDDLSTAEEGSAYVFTRSGTVWSQQQKLTAADAATSDNFGYSVSVSGDTIVVGTPNARINTNNSQGAAYVFARTAGVWSQQQKVTAPDGQAGSQFGNSVAISGNNLAVGAYFDTRITANSEGSAYNFTRSGAVWNLTQKLRASDPAENDQFGTSVAISNTSIISGAKGKTSNGVNSVGAAYIFKTLGPTWQQESRKAASDGSAFVQFGYRVAINGDTAVVSILSNTAGRAYVFVRSGASWTQQQILTASDGGTGAFGGSVGISGDTIVVGAYSGDGAAGFSGAAYIFTRSGGVWTQQQKISAADGLIGDQFGYASDISGDTVIVGARQDDTGSASTHGSAYIFTRSGTTWSQQQKILGVDITVGDEFGHSVAISGNTVVVGAHYGDIGANSNQGSAYVFTRSGSTWTQQQKIAASDGGANSFFGESVDIDGETIIVGAHIQTVGSNLSQGSAYIFVRVANEWSQQQKLTAADGAANDLFGYSVGIDGETAVIGALFADIGANQDQGAAYVFDRAGSVWTQRQKLVASDGAVDDNFGYSVAISGDKIIAGARYSDISTSSPRAPQATDQGAAYFFINAFVPTAANVSISGRVVTAGGRPIRNAIVTLTDDEGNTRSAQTGSFGNYLFDNVRAGRTYVLTVSAKRYSFSEPVRLLSASEDFTDANFVSID